MLAPSQNLQHAQSHGVNEKVKGTELKTTSKDSVGEGSPRNPRPQHGWVSLRQYVVDPYSRSSVRVGVRFLNSGGVGGTFQLIELTGRPFFFSS